MDLTALTADQLDHLRRDVLTEQERRANIERIPQEIKHLADKYIADGGDPAQLEAALANEQR